MLVHSELIYLFLLFRMNSDSFKYNNSGHCDLAPFHRFVPVFDHGGKVGVMCIYCEYVLFEHASNTYVTPGGGLIEIFDLPSKGSTVIPNLFTRFWKKIAF